MAASTKFLSRVGSVRGTLSEARLCALLDNDRETDGVVTSRGGKISRKHYAQLLGCVPSALGRFGGVFARYERELGVVTGPLRHLPEMRAWLEAAYEAQELGLRDGKVDRLAFMAHFELRGGTFITRHPPIRALFEMLDARAASEGYLPIERQTELKRFQAALAGQPALDKDRLTINLVELAKVTRISTTRFHQQPFAEALAAQQLKIRTTAEASRIDPYVHGRVFPFSELFPLWSTPFLKRVGIRFKQIVSGLAQASAKPAYLKLFRALEWIGASEDPHCRAVVVEARKDGRVRSTGEWEDALFAYRDHLIASAATASSVDSTIKGLRGMLAGLASGGVVPATSVPLPGIKNARRRGGHLRSVIEASAVDGEDAESDYVAFVRDLYSGVLRNSGTDIGKGESDHFIDGLAIELRAVGHLPDDPAAAVRRGLERRLDALRSCASAIVEEAIEAHRHGSELLAQARIDGAEFERAYLGDALSSDERTRLVRSLFPSPVDSTEEQVEQGCANLLSLVRQRHDGILPLSGTGKTGQYGQFFAKRYLAYGGLRNLEPMLHPDPNVVGAVLTLYLLESGANVSVGRTLDRDCIEDSDLEDHRRITGHKARAKGKPIIVDLPKSSPAVRAMDWLLSANGILHAAAKDHRDRLFLMRIGSRVQLMTPHWYTNWFKRFAASAPGLEGVGLVPNMLRPSVLLHASLSNDGRLATGMAIGQHGTAVTQGYQQKWPTRLLYDENVRRFHAAFETLVMSGVEDAASKLGITAEQFESRLGELRATGLGTFCRNQQGRPVETGDTCSTLDCWNDCPNLLIVAEVNAIASLQLWQASLRAVQPEWERDRSERWDQVWLPWLCLTDVVEEKMGRGTLIKVWNAAKRRATELSAQAGYVPPRPW